MPDKDLDSPRQAGQAAGERPRGRDLPEAGQGRCGAPRPAGRSRPTLSLIQHVSQDRRNGADVPKQPTGMFIVRNGDDFIRAMQAARRTTR